MTKSPFFKKEHDEVRKAIRQFVAKEVTPFINEWEEKGEFPLEVIRQMGELGFLGLRYPVEVGGQGGDYFMSIVLAEELARCGAGGFPMAVSVQVEMATPPILQFGNKDQHERFLRPALEGKKLAAIGITEPNHGSDVAAIETKGVRDGDEWVINGSKMFITNGPRADFVVLVTRTSPGEGYKGISLFLVETDRPGFSVSRKLDKVGMRSSDTAELILENVRVPHANLLGEEGKGFYQIMWELQGERLIAAAGSVAMAQHAYELALAYAKRRQAFGRSIGQNQVIGHLLVQMATRIEAARQLTYATAYRFSRGEVPSKEISIAKLEAARTACWVADRALQIFGGNGYMQENPIERIWRDVRLYRIGAGTDEVMKEIIAKQMEL
ncbi:acyl-CoA dehydrogenase family protein [Effusibacillus dendaii]|uniref:Citronellyl-CoA dehydrogenase n=1 Tax=Effusibacillus dendaii TaxID=2743772 RepID=A0A7I8D7J5_9BACL|nr:acyl-CoA dehydrogenase family protein [Effusibacillus dendaii]BCJ86118.1 citronellyl-CoA dehydrogenase [Effusibacillus dendaii]